MASLPVCSAHCFPSLPDNYIGGGWEAGSNLWPTGCHLPVWPGLRRGCIHSRCCLLWQYFTFCQPQRECARLIWLQREGRHLFSSASNLWFVLVPFLISYVLDFQCNPNLQVYNVFIENLDERLPRIAFFATRSIRTGEELTFDYNMQGKNGSGGENWRTLGLMTVGHNLGRVGVDYPVELLKRLQRFCLCLWNYLFSTCLLIMVSH